MLSEVLVQIGRVDGGWKRAEVDAEGLGLGNGAGVVLFRRVKDQLYLRVWLRV